MTTSTIKRRRSPSSKTPPPETTTTNGVNMNSSTGAVLSKNSSEEDTLDWDAVGSSTYINPFVHRVNIDNNVDLAKVSVQFFFFVKFNTI